MTAAAHCASRPDWPPHLHGLAAAAEAGIAPLPCRTCGASWEDCTARIAARLNACCGACSFDVTHGQDCIPPTGRATAAAAHVADQCRAALGALVAARTLLDGMGRSDLTATLDGVRRDVAAVLAAHTPPEPRP